MAEFWGMLSGQVLLILSGIAYSIGWILEQNLNNPLSGLFTTGSFILGLFGIILLVYETNILSSIKTKSIRIRTILLVCFIFFILALIITEWLLHRMFTSELFLIMVWTAVEISVITALHNGGMFDKTQTILSLMLIILAVLTGIICYSIHYLLSDFARFINGLIPYAVISVVLAVISIFLIYSKIIFPHREH